MYKDKRVIKNVLKLLLSSYLCVIVVMNAVAKNSKTFEYVDTKKMNAQNEKSENSTKQGDRAKQKEQLITIRKKAKSKNININERESAISLLEKHNDADATLDLLSIVKDKNDDNYIRMRSARALYKIGKKSDHKTFLELKQLLEEIKNEDLRRDIIMAMGRVGQNEAISYLRSLLFNPSDSERIKAGAIYALSFIDDVSKDTILTEGLKNDNTSLTIEYARVLAGIDNKKKASLALVNKLAELYKKHDDNDKLLGTKKMVIFNALGALGDQGTITSLQQYIHDDDINRAVDAALALCYLGDLESIRTVIGRAKNNHEELIVKRLMNEYKKITGTEYR